MPKSIEECLRWIEMIKERRPNVVDLNYFNSIEMHLKKLQEMETKS